MDVDADTAGRLASSIGARASADWGDAVRDSHIDIVIVSTPNGSLREIACAALQAGKHVLVEKPMGRNVGEAVAMASAARDSKRVLKVGFNHRYHPAIAEARRRVSVLHANVEALYAYAPRPHPGTMVYFRAEARRPGDPLRPELPWIELMRGGTEVHVVPGDHMTMHEPPHVHAMAERLRRCLGRVETSPPLLSRLPPVPRRERGDVSGTVSR